MIGALVRAAGVIRRLAALLPADRRLYARAALVQALVIVGLRVRPAAAVVTAAARRIGSGGTTTAAAAAVIAVSRIFGRSSTCLSRALAVGLLCGGDERAVTVVGVQRAADGRIDAHAWVERDGAIVFGGPSSRGYRQLARFEGERWRPA